VLFIEVPFEIVDINVHPTKTEVRFHDTNSLYRAVYHSIADQLAEAPWLEEGGRRYLLNRRPQASEEGDDIIRPEDATFEPLNARHRRLSRLDPADIRKTGDASVLSPFFRPRDEADMQRGFAAPGAAPLREPPRVPLGGAQEGPPVTADNYFSSLRVIGQFRRMYVVCEDRSGLVIVDQHAAHERITFERLKKLFENEHKQTQPLLFPQRLELDAMRAETLGDNLDFFERAGFEIEPFGGNTFALKVVPAVLQNARAEALIRDAIDDLAGFGRSDRVEEAMESVLSRMACHGSVRGPTALTTEECEALLEQMDEIDFKANCPHGRPVYFRIPLLELEESFDRR
jgi:DNA mismatch repair protein MutL